MKIAVLSGKGGAGKTMVAVNLAAIAQQVTYVDCDVEEPNGRLFLKPEGVAREPVCTLLPEFDASKCTGCRRCVEFCRFNALVYIKEKPLVFPEVCHACGGCQVVCPDGAVCEKERPVGCVERGQHGSVRVITGILNAGEASGVPVIKAALRAGDAHGGLEIIDCPPGSACSVMESVASADYCLLVAEPTAFGFHNFQMVYELASLLGKPCGAVINKMDAPYDPLERFCETNGLPILLRIPYSRQLARLAANGEIIAEKDMEYAGQFKRLLEKIGGVRR